MKKIICSISIFLLLFVFLLCNTINVNAYEATDIFLTSTDSRAVYVESYSRSTATEAPHTISYVAVIKKKEKI